MKLSMMSGGEVQEGDEGNVESGGLCVVHGVYVTICASE